MLFTDDLVVIAETEDDLIKRFKEWKDNVENTGIRVNTIPLLTNKDIPLIVRGRL